MKIGNSVFAVVVLSLIASGCQTLSRFKDTAAQDLPISTTKDSKQTETVARPAVKMVVIWQDAVFAAEKATSRRGFGGRIYFFDSRENPVLVDGELTVYGFDDSDKANLKTRPDKKFVFKRENFQKRMSETSMGPSYSIWCPWDDVGGYRKTIRLHPIFRSVDGAVLKGELIENELPGLASPHDALARSFFKKSKSKKQDVFTSARNAGLGNQSSPNQMQDNSGNAKRKGFETYDIELPKELGEKLKNNPATTFPQVGATQPQIRKSQLSLVPTRTENGVVKEAHLERREFQDTK